VLDETVKLLVQIRQLPTRKDELLPSVLIGLKAQRDNVLEMVASTSSRQMVLLHGMGGIGKTTLARAVFNELHSKDRSVPCCFKRLDPGMQSREEVLSVQGGILRELTSAAESPQLAALGDEQLAEVLQGAKVLLVLDNVWGSQLVPLVSGGAMNLLGEGSVVLVTTRDLRACDCLKDDGWVMRLVKMECLMEPDAAELFCLHAYGSRLAPEGEVHWAAQVVARCGGLPMALEVVGRHLRGVNKQQFFCRMDEALKYVYCQERAGRFEKQQTVFEALEVSWELLASDEHKDSLLDMAWFLSGQAWELVECYCREGVLETLRSLALVTKGAAHFQFAKVHTVVEDFCKMVVRRHAGQRLVLCAEDIGDDPIWEELSAVRYCKSTNPLANLRNPMY
jgi:hypothetical protein